MPKTCPAKPRVTIKPCSGRGGIRSRASFVPVQLEGWTDKLRKNAFNHPR